MPAAWEMVQIVTPISAPVAGSGPVPVRPGSLAVLIPHGGEVTSEWALKLRDISLPVGTQMFMSRGMPIDVTRDSMVKAAFESGVRVDFLPRLRCGYAARWVGEAAFPSATDDVWNVQGKETGRMVLGSVDENRASGTEITQHARHNCRQAEK